MGDEARHSNTRRRPFTCSQISCGEAAIARDGRAGVHNPRPPSAASTTQRMLAKGGCGGTIVPPLILTKP